MNIVLEMENWIVNDEYFITQGLNGYEVYNCGDDTEEAKELYKKELEKITFNKESKKTKVIKNIDGTFYSEKDNMVETLSNHIVSPVRFDKTIRLMEQNGIDTYVEIGPGKSLSGFIKKEVKDAKIINICDVKTLKQAIEFFKTDHSD